MAQINIVLLTVYGERGFVIEDIASRLGRIFGLKIVMSLHGGAIPQFMSKFPQWSRRVHGRADELRMATEIGLSDVVRFPGFLDMPGKNP